MAKAKLKEIQIQVAPGVTVVAEISDIGELKGILSELKKAGYEPAPDVKQVTAVRKEIDTGKSLDETPASRVEMRAGISEGSLNKNNLLTFKDDVPQILRPGDFVSVSDATLVLLFAIERGLITSSISFEDFKAIYDEQNIKSGSPLTMMLTNMKNAGYINKSMYSSDRTVRLTGKGEKKAIGVLKNLVST